MMEQTLRVSIVIIAIMDRAIRRSSCQIYTWGCVRILLLIGLLVIFTACSFRIPDTNEQKALEEMGAFPGGTPSWVTAFPAGNRPKVMSSVIPSNFVQPAQKTETGTSGVFFEHKKESYQEKSREENVERSARTPSLVNNKSESVISKIERTCSGVADSLAKAVIVEDTEERIIRYEELLKNCDHSPDLWFLIGKEYLVDGQLSKSEQALQKTIALDPSNSEAISLLEKLKSTK